MILLERLKIIRTKTTKICGRFTKRVLYFVILSSVFIKYCILFSHVYMYRVEFFYTVHENVVYSVS